MSLFARECQRSPGHIVEYGRHSRSYLARPPQLFVRFRRGWQFRVVRAWPEAGQCYVEQLSEAPRIVKLRVVRRDARQGGVDSEAGDFDTTASGPPDAVGPEAQVRQPRGVRARERGRSLRHDPGAGDWFHRARCYQVGERIAERPLQHDVRVVPGVFHVEHLRQPGVGETARSACRGHRLLKPREAGGEGDHPDRPGEYLVDGLPGRPARGCSEPVFEPVPAAEPDAWF